jgi:hypothetical protein
MGAGRAAIGLVAVGMSVALWVMSAHGDLWTLLALSTLRALAVVIVGGLALVAVLARRPVAADDRSGEITEDERPVPVAGVVAG